MQTRRFSPPTRAARTLLAVMLLILTGVNAAWLSAGDEAPAPAGPPPVWAAPDGYKVDKFGKKIFVLDKSQHIDELKKKNLIWDAAKKAITPVGARGEIVQFQLFIEGGADGLKDINVKASKLTGPNKTEIAADQLELFKAWYTEMNGKGSGPTYSPTMGQGWYPDALVPWSVADCDSYTGYDGPPFAVKAGELQEVWIDLHIPYGIPAGDYTGSLEIVGTNTTLPISLHVWDFDIPRKIHNTLFMNFGMDDINQPGANWLKGDKIRIHEEAIYRDARSHRFTAGNMYNEETPKVTEEGGELKSVDWTAYDNHFDKVLSTTHNLFGPGEAPLEIWKVPLYTGIRSGRNGQFPKGDKAWDQMIDEIKKHWKEKGWDLGRAYVYLADEPSQDVATKLNNFAERIKQSAGPLLHSQIAVYTILGKAWNDQKPVFDLWGKNLDQWMVAGDYYNVEMMKTLPKDTLRGMYQGGEPFQGNPTLDSDGVALRSWSWIAWMYKLDFQCYYSMSEAWAGKNKKDNRNNCEIWVNPVKRFGMSEGVFTYPGKKCDYDLPIWNIRTKEIRRGQTDFEYFWLLKQAGEGELADDLVKGVIRKALSEGAAAPEQYGYGKWTHNPDEWDGAIRKAAAKLEELKAKLPKEPAVLTAPAEPKEKAAAPANAPATSAPAPAHGAK